jgi:hypothetical protein
VVCVPMNRIFLRYSQGIIFFLLINAQLQKSRDEESVSEKDNFCNGQITIAIAAVCGLLSMLFPGGRRRRQDYYCANISCFGKSVIK